MYSKDKLNLVKHLVSQGYDSSNNILSTKSGLGVWLQEHYPVAIAMQFLSYRSSLPCKVIFNETEYMNTFQTQVFEIINLIKLSLLALEN